MGISYKKLWVILAERNLRAADLSRELGISAPTFTRMRKGQGVELTVLEKIAAYLNVDFGDIMERTGK
jgi:putative transcriptional regulator